MPAIVGASMRHIGSRIMLAISLSFVGMIVGVGCVLFSPALPAAAIGAVALLLLWVMPDLRVVPYRKASVLLNAFIVSIMCVPVYYALIFPGLPWISFRRAILYPFLTLLLLIIATSALHRQFVWARLRSAALVRIALIGFMGMLVVSTVLGIHVGLTLNSDIALITTVFLPMVGTLLFVRTDRDVERVFKLLIGCMSFDFIVGAIEFKLKHPFLIYLLPAYMRSQIVDSNPLAAISLVTGQGLRGGMYRAASTFTISLTWGEATAMVAPLCLHFIAHSRARRDFAYGLGGIVLCGLSVFLSGSRGAYIGLITATISYSMIWAVRTCRRSPENLGAKIALTLYSMASVTSVLLVLFVRRIHNLILGGGDTQYSTAGRYVEWALAKPKIMARPIWGYGGGTASDVIQYAPVPGAPFTVDGYYMNLLVDYGIPGFLLFTLIFLSAIWLCVSKYVSMRYPTEAWGGAIGASLIAFVIYRTTLSQADNLGLAFIFVGLAIIYQSTCGVAQTSRSKAGIGARQLALSV